MHFATSGYLIPRSDTNSIHEGGTLRIALDIRVIRLNSLVDGARSTLIVADRQLASENCNPLLSLSAKFQLAVAGSLRTAERNLARSLITGSSIKRKEAADIINAAMMLIGNEPAIVAFLRVRNNCCQRYNP